MTETWLHRMKLAVRARGISPALAIWGVVATLATAVTLTFLTIAVFVWLQQRFDLLTAALTLAAAYLVVAAAAAVTLAVARQRTIERARGELAARRSQTRPDPRLLVIGLEIGRTFGWRKGLPLAVMGILAAGIAREWSVHRADDEEKF